MQIDYGTRPHVLQSSTPATASMIQANSRSPTDFTSSFMASSYEQKSLSDVLHSKAGAVSAGSIFGHISLEWLTIRADSHGSHCAEVICNRPVTS